MIIEHRMIHRINRATQKKLKFNKTHYGILFSSSPKSLGRPP